MRVFWSACELFSRPIYMCLCAHALLDTCWGISNWVVNGKYYPVISVSLCIFVMNMSLENTIHSCLSPDLLLCSPNVWWLRKHFSFSNELCISQRSRKKWGVFYSLSAISYESIFLLSWMCFMTNLNPEWISRPRGSKYFFLRVWAKVVWVFCSNLQIFVH